MAHSIDHAGPTNPLTLAIDVGGSHLKAAVLTASGKMSAGPLRVKTPKPATPDAVVAALIDLSQRLGQFDRVSIARAPASKVQIQSQNATEPSLGLSVSR